ncbi:g163 [Coccomyxa elongata]
MGKLSTAFISFCWQQAKDLLAAKPEFDAAGVDLVTLSVGVPEKGKLFCERLPFPEELLFLDPNQVAYRELALYEGVGRTFFSRATPKALSGLNFDKFKEAVKGYTFAILKPPRDEMAFQQGGLFVFDGAEVLYAHKDEGTADHAPMADVLAACCQKQA